MRRVTAVETIPGGGRGESGHRVYPFLNHVCYQ